MFIFQKYCFIFIFYYYNYSFYIKKMHLQWNKARFYREKYINKINNKTNKLNYDFK